MLKEMRISLTNNFQGFETRVKKHEYEIVARSNYIPNSSEMEFLVFSTNSIYDAIITKLTQCGSIEKIFIIREENTFCIWTSLRDYDKKKRYELYNAELEIIKDFSRIEFHFDFHLADPDDIEGLLISGAKLIYPKE
jgi:hypothetical protein